MSETRWFALCFAALAAGIALWQRRASRCDRHSRVAGMAGWGLAIFSAAIAAVLWTA
jgi:hypothetical protein